MAILIFLGLQLLRIIYDRGPARVPFFFGVFAGSCHLATLSTFQNANLWVLLALYGCYEGIVRKSVLAAGQGPAREPALDTDDTKR